MRTLLLAGALLVAGCASQVEREVVVVRGETHEPGREDMDHAAWQAEVMRLAVDVLGRGERPELAERLEHALHAHELEMEGRRDAEAVRIRETAPNLANQIELLMVAREILVHEGREDAAEEVGRLEHELRGHWERGRERERREHGGRHGHPDMEHVLHRFMERTEHLEVKLRRTHEHLERFMERVEHAEMRIRELEERVEREEEEAEDEHEEREER
jgi:hypothetical protein